MITPAIAAFDRDVLVERLLACPDQAGRLAMLQTASDDDAWQTAERLKAEADRLRYQDAEQAGQWCALIEHLGKIAGCPPVEALAIMARALLLYDRAQYREALQAFDRASAIFLQQGHEMGWARTQIGRTVACMALDRYDEALERAQQARTILERHGDAFRLAGLDNNLALLYERLNRPSEAIAYSERVLAYFSASGQTYTAAQALSNHALMLWRLGRAREALGALERARDNYLSLGATVDAAREDSNRGGILLMLGHYAEAVTTLAAARRKLLALGAPYQAALSTMSVLECYVRMGRYRDAVDAAQGLDAALAPFEATADRVTASVWLALACAGLDQDAEGLAVLDRVAGLLQGRGGLASLSAVVDLSRAQLLSRASRSDEAGAILDRIVPALKQAGLAVEAATAQTLRGGLLLTRGRIAEAEQAAAEALSTAEPEAMDWLAARALHLRSLVEGRRQDTVSASRTIAQALRRLDTLHRRTSWDDRAALAGTTMHIYQDAVRLALGRNELSQALYYADRAKARALADHIQGGIDVHPRARDPQSAALIAELGTLRDQLSWLDARQAGSGPTLEAVRFGDVGAGALARTIERRMAEIWRELQAANPAYGSEAASLGLATAVPETDDEAARDLHLQVSRCCATGRAALLEYFAIGDDLILIVIYEGHAHLRCLAGALPAAQRLVSLFRLNLARSARAAADSRSREGLARNANSLLGQLYDVLLRDVMPLVSGAARLIVVPHGATHHVPFHALYDGKQYVIERFEVACSPSAELLGHFDRRHAQIQREHGEAAPALVLSCSRGGSLPHVRREGRWVSDALGAKYLAEAEATRAALLARAADAGLVHVAAHGAFNPEEPMLSWIQLADDRLTTLDVFNLELQCSLVTLSACETALGISGAGDELMGLSRAFLYAGTPSLVLSLWMVEDQATASLMRSFYGALRDGQSKAAALRHAQLVLLHGADRAGLGNRAPFFWAPFVLIGHPGVL